MVKTEIQLRKKESLGMAPMKGGGRTLGTSPARDKLAWGQGERTLKPTEQGDSRGWTCMVCTL